MSETISKRMKTNCTANFNTVPASFYNCYTAKNRTKNIVSATRTFPDNWQLKCCHLVSYCCFTKTSHSFDLDSHMASVHHCLQLSLSVNCTVNMCFQLDNRTLSTQGRSHRTFFFMSSFQETHTAQTEPCWPMQGHHLIKFTLQTRMMRCLSA